MSEEPREPTNEYVFGDGVYYGRKMEALFDRIERYRACYVVLIDDRVTFRRVEYAIDTTEEKVYAIAGLGNSLGDRQRDGR